MIPIRSMQASAQRIGSGDLGHRMSIRTGDELEALANQFNRSAGALQESYETLEQRVEDRTAELRESLDQQTATAEILRVISQSPTDVRPVLDVVVRAARRFCGADDAMIVLREGSEQLLATHQGALPSLVGSRFPLDRSSTTGRATLDGRTIHVPDVADLDPVADAMTVELTKRTNVHALLAAPMLREGIAVGCILLRKPEPGAFTARQIELLADFRRAGRDRHRERSALHRAARIAGPANCDCRDPGSSTRRPAMSRRCSTPSSKRRCCFARRRSARSTLTTGSASISSPHWGCPNGSLNTGVQSRRLWT